MARFAIILVAFAAASIGCSGGSFGGSSGASAGQSGAASAAGSQSPAGGASGFGDSPAAGGSSDSGGAVSVAAGGTPAAGGSEASTGGLGTGGTLGSGGSATGGSGAIEGSGGAPSGGTAGQSTSGGSGGSPGPHCTKEDAVSSLPGSVTLASWSHTRPETGQCATCVSEPCLSCTLVWSDPQWNSDGQAQFTAGAGSACTGTALAGQCGAEQECSLDYEHTDYAANLYLTFRTCGAAWCVEQVDVWRFTLTSPDCLVSWGADYALNDAAEEAFLAAVESSVWECP